MKCPSCNSFETKKVSVIDPKWQSGHQRCKSCSYQDDWIKFLPKAPLELTFKIK